MSRYKQGEMGKGKFADLFKVLSEVGLGMVKCVLAP